MTAPTGQPRRTADGASSRALARLWTWRGMALPALLLLALHAAVTHAGARRLGFVGDTWSILAQVQTGWREALSTPIGYHYIPVASAFNRALFVVFGPREPLYALACVAELAVVGWLLFLLGRRLLQHPLAGLLAGVLLVGSAAFPEIAYWPLVGNFHSLAAACAIGALAAAVHFELDPVPRASPWLFAGALTVAYFTYEATITLLPAVVLWWLVRVARHTGWSGLRPMAVGRALALRFGPCLLLLALMVAAKLRFAAATATATAPEWSLDRLYWVVHRGLGVVTLHSSFDTLHRMLSFGAGSDPARVRTGTLVWLALGLAAAAWLAWRGRPGTALLAVWLAVHLVVSAIALPLAPRHGYLPSLPALLLLTLGLCRAGEALAARLPERPSIAAIGVPLAAVLLLLISAQGELRRVQDLYRRSAYAHRAVVEQALALLPTRFSPPGGRPTLVLVDAPGYLVEGGLSAPGFDNAAFEIGRQRLGAGPLELVHTQDGLRGLRPTGGSRLVGAAELGAMAADPSRLVLAVDPLGSRVGPLAASDLPPPNP